MISANLFRGSEYSYQMDNKENVALLWSYTDEPHASRRREMLRKYPKLKGLMKTNGWIAVQVTITVLLQIFMAYFISKLSLFPFLLLTYVIGGTLNHSLSLSLHEISHNTIFGSNRPLINRLFGMFANLPMGIPAATTFKKYHTDHHRYLGDEYLDGDVPTRTEIYLFSSTIGKLLYVAFQPFFYAFRPMILSPKPILFLELVNWIVQLTFDFCIYYTLSFKALLYMVVGTLLGLSIHPISGHFFAEHYMFFDGFETCSYYGPLNFITYNAGYHVEHHDFPNIPCYSLPQVKEIAKEYYENLPYHTSWCKVLYDFIFRPDMGPAKRIRRKTKFDNVKILWKSHIS